MIQERQGNETATESVALFTTPTNTLGGRGLKKSSYGLGEKEGKSVGDI